ncbi:MAG: SAM-dependent methyltransferase [Opitutaceae bacterium]|nr:SAM-dependent methyltransferase [Opitutaceae bacterium]
MTVLTALPPLARFLALLRHAVETGTLTKLTLGKHRGADPTLKNLHVRPVALQGGPHLAFVWRHATRDLTKNHAPAAALAELERLIGAEFLDAHLFTATETAQFEAQPGGKDRLRVRQNSPASPQPPAATLAPANDRAKNHAIPATAPWLRALGVTNDRAQPREGMADKFRQIQKFAELLTHLMAEAALPADRTLRVTDMGSGKGYLTFALAHLLGDRAQVHGIEARAELVELCNRIAQEGGLANLTFAAGDIATATIEKPLDVLIALHACDTATDDALARGFAAGAPLLVVAPCCQKELRAQLTAPPVLAEPLRHGIFQERQAEFATDALRALLLEWAGYRTKVFEFISTEHTAKNLMIAALKERECGTPDDARAARVREFAAFYGVRSQCLAAHLDFVLTP